MGLEPAMGEAEPCNALVCVPRCSGSGVADGLEAHVRFLIDQALGRETSPVKEVLLKEWCKQYAAAQARDQAAATAGATSPDGSLGATAAPHLPSAAAAAAQKLPWIQELLTMLRPGVPQHLTGVSELQGITAAITMTMALARESVGGTLPRQLMSMLSPFRSQVEELRPLGKGGFGSVTLVRNRLDNKLMAIKQVPFKSPLPPWTSPELLEQRHSRLLREVRALASLECSPYVVRYYHAWLEPQWEKIGQALQQYSQGPAGAGAGAGTGAAGAARVQGSRGGRRADESERRRRHRQEGAAAGGGGPRGSGLAGQAVAKGAGGGYVAGLAQALGLPHQGLVHQMAAGIAPDSHVPPLIEVFGRHGPGHGHADLPDAAHQGRFQTMGVGAGRASPPPPVVIIQGSSAEASAAGSAKGHSADGPDGGSADAGAAVGSPGAGEVGGAGRLLGRFGVSSVVHRLLGGGAGAGGAGRGVLQDGRRAQNAGVWGEAWSDEGANKGDHEDDEGSLSGSGSGSESQGARGSGSSRDKEDDEEEEGDGSSAASSRERYSTAQYSSGYTGPSETTASASEWSGLWGGDGGRPVGGRRGSGGGGGDNGGSGVGALGLPRRGSLTSVTRNSAFTFARDEEEGEEEGEGTGQTRSLGEDSAAAWARLPRITSATQVQIVELNEADEEEDSSSSSSSSSSSGGSDGSGSQAGRGGSSGNSAGQSSEGGSEGSGCSDSGSSSGGSSGSDADVSTTAGAGYSQSLGEGITATCNSDDEDCARSSEPDTTQGESSMPSNSAFGFEPRSGTKPGSRSGSEDSGSGSGSGSGLDPESPFVDRSSSSPALCSGLNLAASALGAKPAASSEAAVQSGADEAAAEGARKLPPGAAEAAKNPHRELILVPPRSSSIQLPVAPGAMLLRQHQGQGDGHRRERKASKLGHGAKGAIVAAPGGGGSKGGVRWPYALYIAMEPVAGVTLDVWLQNRARSFLAAPPAAPTRVSAAAPAPPEALAEPAAAAVHLRGPAGTALQGTAAEGAAGGAAHLASAARAAATGVAGATLLGTGPRPAAAAAAGSAGGLGPVERDIFRQLALGLLHCHSAGIIHRDLKPSNIFVISLSPLEQEQLAHGAAMATGHRGAAPSHTTPGFSNNPSLGHAGGLFGRGIAASLPQVHVKIGDFGLAAGDELGLERHRSASSNPLFAAGRSGSGSFATASSSSGAAFGGRKGSLGAAAAPLGSAGGKGGKGVAGGGGSGSGTGSGSARVGIGGRAPLMLPALASTASSSSSIHTSGVGTASYSAPEQLQGDGSYGAAVDLWPLGLILVELCCPFTTGMERAMALREARAGRLPPSMVTSMPGESHLARCLLSSDPAARPSAWQLVHWLDRLWCSSGGGGSGNGGYNAGSGSGGGGGYHGDSNGVNNGIGGCHGVPPGGTQQHHHQRPHHQSQPHAADCQARHNHHDHLNHHGDAGVVGGTKGREAAGKAEADGASAAHIHGQKGPVIEVQVEEVEACSASREHPTCGTDCAARPAQPLDAHLERCSQHLAQPQPLSHDQQQQQQRQQLELWADLQHKATVRRDSCTSPMPAALDACTSPIQAPYHPVELGAKERTGGGVAGLPVVTAAVVELPETSESGTGTAASSFSVRRSLSLSRSEAAGLQSRCVALGPGASLTPCPDAAAGAGCQTDRGDYREPSRLADGSGCPAASADGIAVQAEPSCTSGGGDRQWAAIPRGPRMLPEFSVSKTGARGSEPAADAAKACSGAAPVERYGAARYEYEGQMLDGQQLLRLVRDRDERVQALEQRVSELERQLSHEGQGALP